MKCKTDWAPGNLRGMWIALLGLAVAGWTAAYAPHAAAEPVAIVFDTDMESDVDDVGTLALLHALADRGEVEILAVMVCSLNPHSAPCADRVNHYYGRGHLPVGNVKGEGVDRASRYARQIAEEFPGTLASGEEAADAVDLYREVLAAQPDGSVTLVTVGYLTNVRNLLRSGPDAQSDLTGVELVRRKVRLWVCMGGRFPSGREHNVLFDTPASIEALEKWPTPIVFSGWELGNRVMTGARLRETPEDNPVRRAYQLFNNLTHRESWDQTAVLYAARGAADYWDYSPPGRMVMAEDGTNTWVDEAGGPHVYLIEKMPPEEVAAEIEELMIAPPAARR